MNDNYEKLQENSRARLLSIDKHDYFKKARIELILLIVSIVVVICSYFVLRHWVHSLLNIYMAVFLVVSPLVLICLTTCLVFDFDKCKKNFENDLSEVAFDVIYDIIGFNSAIISAFDASVIVRDTAALEKYNIERFIKDHENAVMQAEKIIEQKTELHRALRAFIKNEDYKLYPYSDKLLAVANSLLEEVIEYKVRVSCISSDNFDYKEKYIILSREYIQQLAEAT